MSSSRRARRPEIEQLGEDVGQIGWRVDAGEFAGLDEDAMQAQFSAPDPAGAIVPGF
jgi:hypothetical protein